ncbi:pilus assembly protein [Vibrio sp. SCSIO 43136]|uniref:TadE/TadG family type IV pilus assembly protein n=1 Tax=Vibrio sp. SCSIO 43136 TaxID=2819101 RepID=UPI002074F9F5|nr:pilus assembly protein [Vibrio sp. SCSIO 43136]USD64732.1 TadG [Vibrio sp. SCSIO 43136]
MKYLNIKRKQTGHAAMLFAIMVPVLFGLFSLATDGARAMQAKARMDDSLEAASLAVAAHNDDNDDDGSGAGSAINQAIANAYLDAYLGADTPVSNLKITKKACEDIPDCVTGLVNGESRFFEYSVTATSTHDSWFQGDLAAVEESYNVSADGTSRKYQNHAVDVVFVSDFSGSMGNGWSGGSKDKYLDLVDVIKDVVDELQKFNDLENVDDNTVAYVGFNHMVKQSNVGCWVDQLKYSGGSVSYSLTVNNIFIEKSTCTYNSHGNSANFYDISPTTNFTSFKSTISGFSPTGWTASYQGIIRGAQMLNKGNNPRRLMIVLSDGADYSSTNKSISNGLVNSGMCTKIRDTLDAQVVGVDNDQVSSKIAVIGFDYNVGSNAALQNCAGSANVFKAENKAEILNKILELISEEIGHLI